MIGSSEHDESLLTEEQRIVLTEEQREVKRIHAHLAKESHRGCILICAAWLETELGDCLLAKLSPEHEARKLISGDGPAATFSSRILLARCLGILDAEEQEMLNIIRRIRNRAAHVESKKGLGFDVLFDQDSTCDMVDAMKQAHLRSLFKCRPDIKPDHPVLQPWEPSRNLGPDTAEARFTIMACQLAMKLRRLSGKSTDHLVQVVVQAEGKQPPAGSLGQE